MSRSKTSIYTLPDFLHVTTKIYTFVFFLEHFQQTTFSVRVSLVGNIAPKLLHYPNILILFGYNQLFSFILSLDFTESTRHFVTFGNKPDDTVFKWLISESNISGLLKPSCSKHDICSEDGRYPTVRQLESFDLFF